MIGSFRSKALRLYWLKGEKKGLPPFMRKRIERLMNVLHNAKRLEEIKLPGFYFHALKGRGKGRYSLRVTGNWRLTFGWRAEDAVDLDLEDYH